MRQAKASKTQEVVDQQLALEHLKLRVKDASKQLTKNRDIRDKIQGFLKASNSLRQARA